MEMSILVMYVYLVFCVSVIYSSMLQLVWLTFSTKTNYTLEFSQEIISTWTTQEGTTTAWFAHHL